MKLFTDLSGKYQMKIPIDWEYKNPSLYEKIDSSNPQSFGLYDSMVGAFQISCKPINDHITDLIRRRGDIKQSSDDGELAFNENHYRNGSSNVHMFTCAVDDHYFLATYIYDSIKEKPDNYIDELEKVKVTLASIKFIKPEYRDIVKESRRFDLFMSSIAAVMDLKNKAYENKSFVEYVVLSANHIDALLRLSLILKEQIDKKSSRINTPLLFQAKADKPIMEREVYRRVKTNSIITQEIFDKLELLYQERNKVVHRYVITDIRTEDIVNVASDYYEIEEVIGQITNDFEQQQLKKKVGIHAENESVVKGLDAEKLKELNTKIRDKHGKIIWEEK